MPSPLCTAKTPRKMYLRFPFRHAGWHHDFGTVRRVFLQLCDMNRQQILTQVCSDVTVLYGHRDAAIRLLIGLIAYIE